MNSSKLIELGFGDGLVRHLTNFDKSSLLGYRCQPPMYWKTSTIRDWPIVPLWECGVNIAFFHIEEKTYCLCSLEDIEATWCEYKSSQGVLANLFFDLYEDELGDQELREVADDLGFQHIESFLVGVNIKSGFRYEEWRRSFPFTCDG